MTPSERLQQLDLTLPEPAAAVGAYLPALIHDGYVHLSGQIPLRDGVLTHTGRVGAACTVEDAQSALRTCTLNAVGAAAQAAGGVDQIARVVKVVVYVASEASFTDQHKIANAASELLTEIFGDAGRHARAAVGVAALPLNACVELDVLFALRA